MDPPKFENLVSCDTPIPEVKTRSVRQRTIRYRRSELHQKGNQKKCSICGGTNHNKRRCTLEKVSNNCKYI